MTRRQLDRRIDGFLNKLLTVTCAALALLMAGTILLWLALSAARLV